MANKNVVYINHEEGAKDNSSTVRINKWLLIFGTIFFCLAIVGVGLGVYFGTRGTDCQEETTQKPSLPTTPTPPNVRLPTNLYPIQYDLVVKTYIPSPGNVVSYNSSQNFTFDGHVTIWFGCNVSTDKIVMQMSQIVIDNSTLNLTDIDGNPNPLQSQPYTYDNVTQEVTFYPTATLKSGTNYTLQIGYVGKLAGDLRGFYRSSYYENNQLNWLAVTQFEPTDARRALPCFDEPSFKAVFVVTIIHPNDMSAISNAMEYSKESLKDNEGWHVTRFIPTPKMSTYLLAMCVAKFEHMDRVSKRNVTFRVWARPSFIQDAWFAVEAGPKVLDFYAEYFNISFPLVKQDMVALPDFQAGAMENWGMVTYRERDLLYHNGTYCATNLQRTASVIAHELAHQWFGDLVTMDWWDDIWLNEGFADFMMYKGVNDIANDSMHMQLQFTPEELEVALQLDQLATSHPLYDPSLQTPDQIFASFDDISYDKGASINQLLEKVISEEVFRQGLIIYLNAHKYANAAHQDLWNAIQEAVNNANVTGWVPDTPLDVTTFMNSYVDLMGYPVVNVTRNYNDGSVQFKQSHFVLPSNFSGNPRYQNASYAWYIPLWISEQNNVNYTNNFCCWLKPDQTISFASASSPNYSGENWIVVNSDVKGYYRVNYDMKNWKLLQQQLQTDLTAIEPRNRAQLLDDALNLARAGQLDYDTALNTTLYLDKESVSTSDVPWTALASNLVYFNDMFALTSGYQYFGLYFQSKLEPIYTMLGWDDNKEPPLDVLPHQLRQFALMTMCQMENENCVTTALQQFASFMTICNSSNNGTSSCSNVQANSRKAVYCTGISQGGASEFNYLYNKYPEEQIAVERDNILYGLCCSRDPWALTKLLDQAINPSSSFIRQQDSQYVFQYVGINNVGRGLLWDYFTTNWDAISQLFSGGFFSISTMVQSATRSFNTPAQIQQMKDFLLTNGKSLGTGLTTFVQQLETAQANLAWMQDYSDQVIDWFQRNI